MENLKILLHFMRNDLFMVTMVYCHMRMFMKSQMRKKTLCFLIYPQLLLMIAIISSTMQMGILLPINFASMIFLRYLPN